MGRGVPFRELAFISPSTVSFTVEESNFAMDLESYEIEKAPPALFEYPTRYVTSLADRSRRPSDSPEIPAIERGPFIRSTSCKATPLALVTTIE